MLHETDHCDGIVFLDRMSPLKREIVKRRIKKLQKAGEWAYRYARLWRAVCAPRRTQRVSDLTRSLGAQSEECVPRRREKYVN
jgi:hypothetical protein